jgi:acyl carrier protein
MRLVDGDGRPVNRHSEVGLLELSGPVVFPGYANNEKATKDVFSGTWFTTGDKGYLDANGRLILHGRAKDTIIINGTNFFSHEIESMIKVANIIGVEPSHVVVIPTWNEEKGTEEAVVLFQPTTDAYEQRRLLLSAVRKIANAVVKLCARYPNEIIPLPSRYFQKSSLGKILRQKLKLQYDQGEFDKFRLGEEKIVSAEPEQDKPQEGPVLQKLRSVWSEVLDKPESLIRTDDNFFDLGGDSIKVIRLISELQAHELSLNAEDVFEYQYLGAMSSRCQKHEGEEIQNTGKSVRSFSATVHAQYLDIPMDTIESVSQCSTVQEGLVASSVKKKGHNIVHQKYVVDSEDFQSWSAAWAEVINRHPLLRTRFYASPEGLLQVVTNVEKPRFSEFSSRVELEQYLESLELRFGGETVWFSLERGETTNQVVFVWSCHHAVIDGWSAKLILDDLSTLLTGGHISTTNAYATFDRFIDYARKTNKEQAERFWRDRLQDVTIPRVTFFKEPGLSKAGKLNTFHMDTPIDISALRGSSITITSILRGAFGFTLARHMGCEEV